MTARGARVALVAVALVAVVAAVLAISLSGRRAARLTGAKADGLVAAAQAKPAPELRGVTAFDNTAPVTMTGLRGRVVLVDFWTYTCINCRRTLPFLRALSDTYGGHGLTVLGVHSPEFGFEKSHANVARAVRDLKVTWPVAEDPDHATWDAWHNQYWPADYLVDKQGRVRLFHAGEGGEDGIEAAVRALLAEGGGDPGTGTVGGAARDHETFPAGITPELYLGQRPDEVTVTGHTTTSGDALVAGTGGATLTLHFHARDVYLLAAPGETPATLGLTLDDHSIPADRRGRDVTAAADGTTTSTVTADDLRHLVTGRVAVDGTLKLVVPAGVHLYTFTFGS